MRKREEWLDIDAENMQGFINVLSKFDDSYRCKGRCKFTVRKADDEIIGGQITLVFSKKEGAENVGA